MLVGNTQTRELHPMDAGCAMVWFMKVSLKSQLVSKERTAVCHKEGLW